MMNESLRDRLVRTALDWEQAYGVAPSITSAVSEYDAAKLLGLSDGDFRAAVGEASAVRRGFDFEWKRTRYQIKANRPSGKKGSFVTLVGKAKNYDFDQLLWLLYDKSYVVQEAWQFPVDVYREQFDILTRLSPMHMRRGVRLT